MNADKTLHVHVGKLLADSLARVAHSMHTIERGESPTMAVQLPQQQAA